ncbi:MAG: 4Fe-4S binding protein [Deltaproteobacteria bacterium]
MSSYALVVDHEACWGCRTCEVACAQEYDFENKFLLVTEEGPTQEGSIHDYTYRVNVCRHCDDPPCVEACPEAAISKRDDGIVILDYDACTGCQDCIEACPYDAIGFDEEKQTALKCNLCHHRVDQGLLPACADNVCLAHCIYFGDPDSVEKFIEQKRQKRQTR